MIRFAFPTETPAKSLRSNTVRMLISCGAIAMSLGACGGGDDGDSASGLSYCDQVKEIRGFDKKLDAADSSDPKQVVEQIDKLSSQMKSIAKSAPGEIKDEWSSIADAFSQVSDLMAPLKDIDLSDPAKIDPKKLEEMQSIGTKMGDMQKTLQENGKAISAFTKKECGFDLDS